MRIGDLFPPELVPYQSLQAAKVRVWIIIVLFLFFGVTPQNPHSAVQHTVHQSYNLNFAKHVHPYLDKLPAQ